MSRACKICGRDYEISASCPSCGYNPMAAREEQLIRRDEILGTGALSSDRPRTYILTSTRYAIIRSNKLYNEFRLKEISSIEVYFKRHYGVLGFIVIAFFLTLFRVTPFDIVGPLEGVLFTFLAVFPFLVIWYFWKDPVVRVIANDEQVFEDRLLKKSLVTARAFVESVKESLKPPPR